MSLSNEERLSKVAEEQAIHIAALKEKLDKIDNLTSKDFSQLFNLYIIFRGPSIRRSNQEAPRGDLPIVSSSERGSLPDP